MFYVREGIVITVHIDLIFFLKRQNKFTTYPFLFNITGLILTSHE